MGRETVPPGTLCGPATPKARWRVSLQALLQRGRSLGILDESRHRYVYTQISVKGWRKDEPVEVPLEKPRLLRQLFERAYGNHYEALANDLGYRAEFVKEILSYYDDAAKPKEPSNFSAKVVALRRHYQ